MHRLRPTGYLLVAFVLLAWSRAAPSQDATRINVQFEPGESSATYRDRIRGYQTFDYVLRAEAGQKLTVRYASDNTSSYINIFSPGADEAMHRGAVVGNRFEGSVPQTGEYRVQVFLMRNAARRDETAEFTLELELTPTTDFADGLAGGPDFWAVTLDSGGQLNVRSSPSTGANVVASLDDGTVVRNLGCTMESGSRWCRVGVLEDDAVDGWVAGRFLREAAPPGGSGGTTIPADPEHGTPELFVRSGGEIEVRWESGCTALYDGNGSLITAGSSCSDEQRRKSAQAVEAYRRDQDPD